MTYEYVKRCVGIILLTFAAIAFAAVSSFPQHKEPEMERPAEQVYKNIQVLKGVPASKIRAMMNFMNASLGVGCAHCHVPREWEKEDKPQMQVARRMLQMVSEINRTSFGGKPQVNCYTCHRGAARPATIPAISQVNPDNAALPPPAAATAGAMIGVDQLLERYVEALGGRARIERVKTRFMKGTVVSTNSPVAKVEIYGKAPNKFLVVNTFDPSTLASEGFDGKVGWGGNLHVAHAIADQQLAKLKRDAEFFKAVRLKELYTNVALTHKEMVDGREAYVIEATAPDGNHEKLFFDAQSSLLVRIYVETETALGLVPFQFDFQDYRDVGGVKEPFLVRLSFPDSVLVRKFTEIKHGVEVEDSKFALADPKR